MDRPSADLVQNFTNSLQGWVDGATAEERRAEARDRIVKAYQTNGTFLSLANLKLTSLPDRIWELTQLTELYLSSNRLTFLPDRIGELTQLTRLSLSSNQLTSLPDRIWELTQLTRLSLSGNRLTSLPDRIGELTQLTELELANNRLTSLPDRIGELTQLTDLYLSINQLTSLPDRIGELTQLTELYLFGNQLTSLPETIFRRNSYINATDNLFSSAKAARLNAIAQERHCRFEFSICDTAQIFPPSTRPQATEERRAPISSPGEIIPQILHAPQVSAEEIIAQILHAPQVSAEEIIAQILHAPQVSTEEIIAQILHAPRVSAEEIIPQILAKEESAEKKEELEKFLTTPEMERFKQFAAQCSRTESWKNIEEGRNGVIAALHQILRAMNDDETNQVRDAVLKSIEGAYATCGDRVAMALVDAQLDATIGAKKINEMTAPNQIAELLENARKGAVVAFLKKQAAQSFESRGGDEVEVFLAYMQAAKNLGVNLLGADMLYRFCSNVSDDNLKTAVSSFNATTSPITGMSNSDYLTYSYMLDSGTIFHEHPFVKQANAAAEEEIDKALKDDENSNLSTSAHTDETDDKYQKRLEEVTQPAILQIKINALKGVIERARGEEERKDASPNPNLSSATNPANIAQLAKGDKNCRTIQ